MNKFDTVRIIEDAARLGRDHIAGLAGRVGIIVCIERQTYDYVRDPGGGPLDVLNVETKHGSYWMRAEHVIGIDPTPCTCEYSDDHMTLDYGIVVCYTCNNIWREA